MVLGPENELDEGRAAEDECPASRTSARYWAMTRRVTCACRGRGWWPGRISTLERACAGRSRSCGSDGDADAAVPGDKSGLPGRSVHDAQIGDGELCGLGGWVDAGHRAAGGHDALDILREQECDVLPGILQNSLRAAAAVGDAAGIAEVDDILVGEALAQLPHAGQTAKAAVEYADGTVIHAAFPSFPEPER